MDEKKPMENMSSDSKLMAAFSYVWIISVVMLFIKKNDPFVRFHAQQGTVLFLISFVAWIPILWWLWFFIIILDLIGFLKALAGEKFRMPVVADIGEKIAKALNV